MLRRLVDLTLLVSFVALASSGVMMGVIEAPSFTIQMHPVHKIFGMLLVVAGMLHVVYNRRTLLAYIKHRGGAAAIALLGALLIALYAVALSFDRHTELGRTLDNYAKAFEETRER